MSFKIEMPNDRISLEFLENIGHLVNYRQISRIDGCSEELKSLFPDNWAPKPCILSSRERHGDEIKNFIVYPDDVWLISYPKSGSTWCQEMVWLICNNLDFEGSKLSLTKRFQYLEFMFNNKNPDENLKFIENMQRPRFIKTHLPVSLLPDGLWTVKPKVIYLARNPKDVIVSWFHHHVLLVNYQGTIDKFTEAFLADKISSSPYYDHVKEFYHLKSQSNILFLTYEMMKEDLKSIVNQILSFLNREYRDDQIDLLLNHLSFESMRNNNSVNKQEYVNQFLSKWHREITENSRFIRKGQAGGWRSEITPELSMEIDSATDSRWNDELKSIFKTYLKNNE